MPARNITVSMAPTQTVTSADDLTPRKKGMPIPANANPDPKALPPPLNAEASRTLRSTIPVFPETMSDRNIYVLMLCAVMSEATVAKSVGISQPRVHQIKTTFPEAWAAIAGRGQAIIAALSQSNALLGSYHINKFLANPDSTPKTHSEADSLARVMRASLDAHAATKSKEPPPEQLPLAEESQALSAALKNANPIPSDNAHADLSADSAPVAVRLA